MRIAGIYPQDTTNDNIIARNTFGEPLGLELVLAVVEREGHTCRMFMPINESLELFIDKILAFKPDVCAVSLMTCQVPYGNTIIEKLKRQRPGILAIAGGYHPSAMRYVESPYDFYVVGEGEETFADLIKVIESKGDLATVRGISYCKSGKPVLTSPAQRIHDLSAYPDALRCSDILSLKYYGLVYPPPSKQTGHAYIEHTRGCTARCTFCCKDVIWDQTLTYHQPNRVVDEMERLIESHGVNLFFFTDLNFTQRKARVVDLCNTMIKRGVKTNWFCMSNLNTARSTEILDAMSQAGCCKIMFGVESVYASTLRKMHKPAVPELAHEVMHESLRLGILNHMFYMIGLESDDATSIRESIDSICNIPAHSIRIGIATPLPGSQWYDNMKSGAESGRHGLHSAFSLDKYDCENLVYKHPKMDNSQAKALMQEIFQRFYSHSGYAPRMADTVRVRPHVRDSFVEYLGGLAFPVPALAGLVETGKPTDGNTS